ncbi:MULTISPECIES: type II toxin-antitoxin system PemK/MazF family toxin [Proteus]|uniref:type II toxin-antitoxin system PemK/MazF family toxin n=1 Tax=Proteus TaxID=583 RepID=UPI0018E412F1|nr:type II toxin-antitoxin system PemK/MazF family toxin [Proteus sp. PR00224]MBI6338430.1 type II toxin-antitoxin system PemK/MazF family toxin [Proteus sp. PR00224]
MIRINYFEFYNYRTEILLGHVILNGINEIITPLFRDNIDKENFYPVFITKSFIGRKEHRWEIKSSKIQTLSENNIIINIWLSPRNVSDDIYLSQTLKNKNYKSAKSILYLGKIIIVEFGHIFSCVTLDASIKTNKRYPDNIQQGEMHKRRPAIVVKADDRGVKVIPLTSKKPHDLAVNSSIFKLSDESIKNIGDLAKKETYALCDMIQTICVTRILPPLFKLNTRKRYYRHEDYRASICRNDRKLLDKGLLSSISKNKLYSELEDLKIKNNKLESEIYHLKNNLLLLKEMYMYTNGSHASHIDEIDNEILLYKNSIE